MQFAPLYPILYKILKPTFPSCLWSGGGDSRSQPNPQAIALTFDDGPHPEHTPRLLEVLDEYGISASFFWLGVCVERYKAIAQAVAERGHWIGIHGYDHRNFPTLSSQELRSSLQKTQQIISDTCSISPTKIIDVRPPNGLFTPKTLQLLHQWQYRPVMWSVVPEDWTRPGITKVAQRVMTQTMPGSLIVLHDGYSGGEDCAASTQIIIPQLLAKDYQFVTVDQLWQEKYSTFV